MDRTLSFLKELVDAHGVPGFESDVALVMAKHLKGVGKFSKDRLGSFICEKVGDPKGPRVMLAGHLDEVGFMVKSITKESFRPRGSGPLDAPSRYAEMARPSLSKRSPPGRAG